MKLNKIMEKVYDEMSRKERHFDTRFAKKYTYSDKLITLTIKITAREIFKDIEEIMKPVDELVATLKLTHPFLISKNIEKVYDKYQKLKKEFKL